MTIVPVSSAEANRGGSWPGFGAAAAMRSASVNSIAEPNLASARLASAFVTTASNSTGTAALVRDGRTGST